MMGCEESKVTTATTTEWDPYSFCDGQMDWEAEERPPFALVILNQAITNPDLLAALWKNCGIDPFVSCLGAAGS